VAAGERRETAACATHTNACKPCPLQYGAAPANANPDGRRMPRVVAPSIDGNEAAAGRTGPRFAEAFRKAGAAGLRRTVHAGESSGPEGVRDAIELLGADLIDHGVRAIEDNAVVALLAERGISLGVCPTSNIALKVYPSMEAHPLDRPLRRGGKRRRHKRRPVFRARRE
jgi:adenosine deaminase